MQLLGLLRAGRHHVGFGAEVEERALDNLLSR